MEGFRAHDPDSAPVGSRNILIASEKRFGFLPAPVSRAAESPELLAHLMASFAIFDKTSLSGVEREVVAMTVAFENECHYCMAMHSTLASREHPSTVVSLRGGTPLDDPKLEALRCFTREVLLSRARVSLETWDAFLAAGYDRRTALDVVLGVGTYVMSTLANVLTEAPVDSAFASQAWEKPR